MIFVKYRLRLITLIFFIISIVILYNHNVEKKLTKEDIKYIELFIEELNIKKTNNHIDTFENEIHFISNVHKKVLDVIVDRRGIDIKNTREPKDLYLFRRGECFDISRLLEKIYTYYGYDVRHLSIYEKIGKYPIINLFFKKNNDSHAISQIYTKEGWLSIDSVSNWIGIDINNQLINLDMISETNNWQFKKPHHIFEKNYFVIYGLYSRHGLFYPPFNRLPDINFLDFLKFNLFSW